ncbi:Phosphoribosylanthranilate isomerase [hydrothermal vent metagenome]|uniref:phosphoribosylanthranilate isomerase n=1 Tax=hydrothermal vent metagenome TaxID=652676 RepID=A0A3B1BH67_9ZZZZ
MSLGADALGLVFYPPSPRALTMEQAQLIIAALPPFVTTVGLFVNEAEATIRALLKQVPLDLLQFHGDEPETECCRFGRPYIKALRMEEGADIELQARQYKTASGILLDSFQPGVPGGTGQTFDWTRIPKLDQPLILAGGLNPGNVRAAVETVQPYAVDVSGGVEAEKGIKDQQKMAAFINEVSRFASSKE